MFRLPDLSLRRAVGVRLLFKRPGGRFRNTVTVGSGKRDQTITLISLLASIRSHSLLYCPYNSQLGHVDLIIALANCKFFELLSKLNFFSIAPKNSKNNDILLILPIGEK